MTAPKQGDASKLTEDQIIELVGQECADFKLVPKAEKWVLALHAYGISPGDIATRTGRKVKLVEASIKKWGEFTTTLPDHVRCRLAFRTLWLSLPKYIENMIDPDKIKALSPSQSMHIASRVPGLMGTLMGMEKTLKEHEAEVASLMPSWDGFGKSLPEHKEE